MQRDGVLTDRPDAHAGPDVHAVRDELVLDPDGHLGVERGEDLVGELDEGDVQPAVDEVLRDLDPDESTTDDDRVTGVVPAGGRDGPGRVDAGGEAIDVGDVAQDEHAVGAGDGRDDGSGAGTEHQLVVGLGVRAVRAVDGDRAGGGVDVGHPAADADVQAEPGVQRGRGLQEERVTVLDDAADVVGQAAVGVRDVLARLQDDDLGLLVQATQTRGRRHAGGDAANDHDLHAFLLGFDHHYTPGGIVMVLDTEQKEIHHVPTGHLQVLRKDDLGGLRPARRRRHGRRPPGRPLPRPRGRARRAEHVLPALQAVGPPG